MAQQMTEQQRLKVLESFNPQEHLIGVGKDRQGKVTMYYPAAWRLYELNLRYPNANFKSEVFYMNEERNFVIVKAYLYLGSDYATSEKKAEAMKQGLLSALDKVETAAKARCARDFGVGTEYALDMEADETDAKHDEKQNSSSTATPLPTSKEMFARGREKGLWGNSSGFYAFASAELGFAINADSKLSAEHRLQLSKAIDEEQSSNKAS